MTQFKQLSSGLFLTTGIGIFALAIQRLDLLQQLHFNSLIIAILLGMIINNTIKLPKILEPGIVFSSKFLLRLAIILLGFKLSFAEVMLIGGKGFFLVTIVTTTTIIFTLWLGTRMGLDRKLALLIGAGSAICGASAVAAVAPVANAEERDTTFAIATVTIFGTISMFMYPLFYRFFHLPDLLYAVWTGASIHEVAQVVAAGFAAGEEAGQMATLIKLTRVLLVIPMAVIVGAVQIRRQASEKSLLGNIVIPWFVFGFLAMVMVNSLNIVPATTVNYLIEANGIFFTIAMAGLGLSTNLDKMKKVGLGPFYVGLLATVFITIVGFVFSSLFFN